jgi:hypothetical protein
MKDLKIGLTGPTSTGKTTLARDFVNGEEVNSEFQVRYCAVDTTSALHDMGYNSHEELIRDGEPANYRLQESLIQRRAMQAASTARFITDRTPLDALVYYATSNLHENDRIAKLRELAFAALGQYTLVVYTPLGVIQHEENGVRLNSPLYHGVTESVFYHYIDEYNALRPKSPIVVMESTPGISRELRAWQLRNLAFNRLLEIEKRAEIGTILSNPL